MTTFGGSQWAIFLAEAGSNTTQASYRATRSQQPTPAKLHHQLPPTIHQPRHTAPRERRAKKEENAHRATAKTGSQKHNFSKGERNEERKECPPEASLHHQQPKCTGGGNYSQKESVQPRTDFTPLEKEKNLPQPPARIALTPGRAKDG